jgi:hypothetical protein
VLLADSTGTIGAAASGGGVAAGNEVAAEDEHLVPEQSPYCRRVMDTWLHTCVFSADKSSAVRDCKLIFNTWSLDCLTDSGGGDGGSAASGGGEAAGAKPKKKKKKKKKAKKTKKK